MKCIRMCILPALLAMASVAAADTTITYQGQLRQSGIPFTGTVDLEFELFDQLSGGAPVAPVVTRDEWPVEDGLFQADLDFGVDAFTAQVRYLEIRVDGVALSPRQAVRPAPMALFALAGNEGPEGPEGPPGDSHWQVDGSATFYADGPVGIGTSTPLPAYALDVAGSTIMQRDSTTGQPQLYLYETQEGDFARLNYFSAGGERFWSIAGRSGDTDPTTGILNFYNSTSGDLLSIRGDGSVGVGTTAPAARLSVASQDQWHPGAGTGRGDFYIGDGGVGLSVGVALGGGGRGVTRMWTGGGVEYLFIGSAGHGTSLSVLPGQVGVNNTNPGNTLDVAGGLRVRDLAHAGPGDRPVYAGPDGDLVTSQDPTRILSLPASTLRPETDGLPFHIQNAAWIDSGTGRLVAPVTLPDGAVVTEVRIFYYDNSTSDVRVRLCHMQFVDNTCLVMLDFTSLGMVEGFREAIITSFLPGDSFAIDMESGALDLTVRSSAWDGFNTRFGGIQFVYSVP